jgi:tetratricopeptide (TPR) repeat protein
VRGPAIDAAVAAAYADDEAAFIAAAERAAAEDADPAKGWRLLAVALTAAGLPAWAVHAQRHTVAILEGRPDRLPDDETFLGDLQIRAGDLGGAISTLQGLLQREPHVLPAALLLAGAWSAAGRFVEAERAYRVILAQRPNNTLALDGLSRAAGWLGHDKVARRAGRSSLELKDAAVRQGPVLWHLDDRPPRPFDPTQPRRNVITFSLWGEDPRYVDTALHNAEIARDVFPAWHCRFHCDTTVPQAVRDRLAGFGADVVMEPVPRIRHAGLFWRFKAADDPTIDRFLVRDADALLTVRDRVAVDDWLASPFPFHAMRDWWSHTDLLLAGMWGGCGSLLSGIADRIADYLTRPEVPNRALDQGFLGLVVWPSIRGRCLVHDDLFGALGARPFPPLGHLPPGEHVGMNVSALGRARAVRARLPRP